MLEFTNPRLVAEFSDWPIGGAHRGKCVFRVHRDKRGWRVSRTTQDRNGKWCKSKYTTYSGQAAIVDGSDGRTYVLEVAPVYGFITVRSSNFLNANIEGGRASVFQKDDPEQHAKLLALIVQGASFNMPVE